MPVLINLAANLLFGAGMATVSRNSPAFRNHLVNWSLLFLLGFIALVITPASTYAFRFYPQWSLLYYFDPRSFPSLNHWLNLLSFVAVLANFAAALIGFSIARLGLLKKNSLLWMLPFIVGTLTLFQILIFQFDRVAFIASYDLFWQGKGELAFIKVPGLIGCAVYVGAFIFTLWVHSRFSERDPELI